MSEATRDITDAEFPQAVVERSREIPVVIDLWAPWCGPCRQLGPVLEKIAHERADDFELVKLNVDENPQVAGALGARSIPLVVAFRDGKKVSQFVGAQPAAAIHRFIDSIVPSPADRKVTAARAALDADDLGTAEARLREAIAIETRHEEAHLTLASLLVHTNRLDEAMTSLDGLASSGHDAIARMKAEIRVRMSGETDIGALRAQVAANPDDADAFTALGSALGASGKHEEALETLLRAVQLSGRNNDKSRKAMLDLFDVIGAESPLVKVYRRQLAKVLF